MLIIILLFIIIIVVVVVVVVVAVVVVAVVAVVAVVVYVDAELSSSNMKRDVILALFSWTFPLLLLRTIFCTKR